MEEIWKDIPGFDGLYQVSTYGRVRSLLRRHGAMPYIMKPVNHGQGPRKYKQIQLSRGGKSHTIGIHRLVALAFIPRIEGKNHIDHIDGDPSNNHVENLRWCTHLENMNNPITRERERQAIYTNPVFGHKLSEETKAKISRARKGKYYGEENPFYGKKHTDETRKKLSKYRTEFGGIPIVQLSLSGDYIRQWQGAAYAARGLGISSSSSIIECCRGKRKTIGGYKWKYLSDYGKEERQL